MEEIYMTVTNDELELPLELANSLSELSAITGASLSTLSRNAKTGSSNRKGFKVVKVYPDDEEKMIAESREIERCREEQLMRANEYYKANYEKKLEYQRKYRKSYYEIN